MLIVIFGESCTGKITLANNLKEKLNAKVFSGKDYLRLAKNENDAKKQFCALLKNSVEGENLIYVIAQKEHLALVPNGAIKILTTQPLDVIKERFSKRTGGTLPPPVAKMLEANHGCFDAETYDYKVDQNTSLTEVLNSIAN